MENLKRTLKNVFSEYRSVLSGQYENREIESIFYLLCETYLGFSKTDMHLNAEMTMETDQLKRFDTSLESLKQNTPVQYIIGVAHFYGLEFKVTPDVLIPRPETEEMVDLIIRTWKDEQKTDFSILDIGTGSGCIAISLSCNLPRAKVSGVDISRAALDIAHENAIKYGCSIDFREADILSRKDWARLSRFDIIVSNPPYVLESERAHIHRNVLDYEPDQALFVHDPDPLLFYNAIGDFAVLHLNRPGTLYFEINEKYGSEVCGILHQKGFDSSEIIRDIHGKERFVKAGIISA